jgi:hypothetical protein
MKGMFEFKDIRIKQVYQTPDDLRHTTSFSHVSILARSCPDAMNIVI